jgi:hypothetical protein
VIDGWRTSIARTDWFVHSFPSDLNDTIAEQKPIMTFKPIESTGNGIHNKIISDCSCYVINLFSKHFDAHWLIDSKAPQPNSEHQNASVVNTEAVGPAPDSKPKNDVDRVTVKMSKRYNAPRFQSPCYDFQKQVDIVPRGGGPGRRLTQSVGTNSQAANTIPVHCAQSARVCTPCDPSPILLCEART